ncbi:MAG: hypothetical protein AAGM22_33445, partial [Acidobacteriota bacterium]
CAGGTASGRTGPGAPGAALRLGGSARRAPALRAAVPAASRRAPRAGTRDGVLTAAGRRRLRTGSSWRCRGGAPFSALAGRLARGRASCPSSCLRLAGDRGAQRSGGGG